MVVGRQNAWLLLGYTLAFGCNQICTGRTQNALDARALLSSQPHEDSTYLVYA